MLALSALIATPAAAASLTADCRADPSALERTLAAATAGDTVVVRGTCVGNFEIGTDLTLVGAGRHPTLDGGGSGVVLGLNFSPLTGPISRDAPPPTIRVVGLTITGGDEAGAVNWATSELERVTIRDNAGDGLFSHAHAVTVRESAIRSNGQSGIQSMAPITVVDSTVGWNGESGLEGGPGFTVIDSIIEGNGGRGLQSADQTGFLVERSIVRGNRGGGIAVLANSALVLRDSKVVDNHTPGNGGGILAPGSLIAGMQIEGSRIAGNTAGGDGGGLYTSGMSAEHDHVDSTVIRDNVAAGRGGGVFNGADELADAVLVLPDTAITHNRAGVAGGGIYNEGRVELEGGRLRRNLPDDCVGC